MNEQIIKDAAAISSDTLATLTGENKYEVIDQIKFVDFVIKSDRKFSTWMDAWNHYWYNRFIYVVEIELGGYDGNQTSFHRTEAGANAYAAQYVRENWYLEGEPPANDDEAVDMYFDTENQKHRRYMEFLDISKHELEN